MKRLFWNRVLVACSLALAPCATVLAPQIARAQTGEARTVYLWDGSGATDSRVAVRGWGNGGAKPKTAVDYPSRSALEVTTRNFYEGARFVLSPPLDLTPYRANGFLRLRLRSENNAMQSSLPANSSSGRPGFPGSAPGSAPGGFPGAFTPGGAPTTAPGVYNPIPSPTAGTKPDPSHELAPIEQIQVVMHLEKGALFGQFAFGSSTESSVRFDQFGWQSFVLRLSSLRATPNASGALRSVVLSGNSEGTFQIGQLALAPGGNNSVSIRRTTDAPGTQQTELTIAPDTILNLVADVETGDADSQIEWNFDADKSGSLPAANPEQPINGSPDGSIPARTTGAGSVPGMPGSFPGMPGGSGIALDVPRLDARGVVASFTYPNEEQDYRVEVTVLDRLTRRELGKASLLVHVRTIA